VPPETFHGPDIPTLLARARAVLGEDAVVLSVRGAAPGAPGRYRIVAERGAVAPAKPGGARAGSPPQRPLRPLTRALLGDMHWPLADRRRRDGHPPVLALVGPTGAGKTTTIAKLVNHPDVFGDARIGLLCLDTYRIGGVEQLAIYADLSGLPLEVVHETRDVTRAWRRLRDCDVIVVDTAGRGPSRDEDVNLTRSRLAELAPREVHLVLPAGLGAEHARELLRRHRPYGVTHLLASKLDECPRDRTVLELAEREALAMRWCTDGQEVPSDLRAARVVWGGGAGRVAVPEGVGA